MHDMTAMAIGVTVFKRIRTATDAVPPPHIVTRYKCCRFHQTDNVAVRR